MEHGIHVEKMGVDRRRKLSHPKTIKHHRFLSVLHLKKTSHRHQSCSIQHFVINDEQSNDTIHTTIQQSGDNISSILSEFNNRNKHSQSTSSILSSHPHNNQPKKSIVSQKSIQFVENKVKPIDVTKIQQHDQSAQTPSNNVFNENSQRRSDSFSTTSNTNSLKSNNDDQRLSVATINSNQLDNNNDITEQKKPSISFEKNFSDKSDHKFQMKKKVQRSWLCKLLVPLISLLILAAITALVIGLIKPRTDTNLATSSAAIASINITNTLTTSTSTTSRYITTTTQTITFTSTTIDSTTSTSTVIGSSTSTSITSTITTTKITTSSSTMTESTTSISTTSTSATTVSTTTTTESTTTTTASTTSMTTTTLSTTSTSVTSLTTTTEATTSTTTTTESSTSTSVTSSTTTTEATTSTTTTTESSTSTSVTSSTTTTEATTSTTTTTESTTSTTITTESTTSTSTTTESTTSTTITTESTTSTTTTTESTTSTTPTTESTTSMTTTTESTTSTTITTESTTSATTTTESTTSTTKTSTTTTTPSINPCLSGIYWNVNGVIYAGNGTAGAGMGQLSSPAGIFINANDTLYVSDSSNYRIISFRINAINGSVVAGSGSSGTAFNRFGSGIRGVYVDANGYVYITDTANDRIMRWISGGSNGTIVAGNGNAGISLNQLNYPYGVWVDSNSNVFVTEFHNHRITKWAPGSSVGVVVAGITNSSGSTTDRLSSPACIYYDEANQDLYISNSGSYTIMRWRIGESNGTILAGIAGSPGTISTKLNVPTGITLDRWKNIYVNDRSNDRIQLFCNGNSTGITIAGRGAGGTNFSNPFDVKLDSQLNLYVADFGTNSVLKFFKL